MDSSPHDLGDLQERLAALEKQNRRFKQLGAVLLIAVASLAIMGQTSAKKTVEANEFIVRDASGRARIELAVDAKSGSPEISLFDTQGKSRVKLEAGLLPGLDLYDSQGRQRGILAINDILGSSVVMFMHEDGKPGTLIRQDDLFSSELTTLQATSNEFTLMDDHQNKRARLFMTAGGTTKMTLPGISQPVAVNFSPSPTLALYDEKGQTRAFLDARNISFFDSKGRPVTDLGIGILTLAGDGGSGAVLAPGLASVFDEQGFSAALGVQSIETPRTGETHKTSAASLLLFDKDKNVIWKAP